MARNRERLTDAFLILAARGGDEAAFGILHERWQRRVLTHAYRRVRDAEGAHDVAQEAWIEVARSLPRLRDVDRFASFCLSIVTHRAADWLRHRARQGRVREDLQVELATESEDTADEVDLLRAAMRDLPDDQQQVLHLFYLEELSIEEVAGALHIPAGTVKSRLFHARQNLKQSLDRRNS